MECKLSKDLHIYEKRPANTKKYCYKRPKYEEKVYMYGKETYKHDTGEQE